MAGSIINSTISGAVLLAGLSAGPVFAADSIVIEPEPVEYVRVCDAYGSGFFYIPGTETCLRFGGYVRSSYEKIKIDVKQGSQLNGAIVGFPFIANFRNDHNFTTWGNRARLNIDTRSETDWGTLRTLYRIEGGQSNVDDNASMDVALISLAGFRAGYAGSNYWSSNHGFGWVNSEGIGFNAGGIAPDDGLYGFDDGVIFDYTWAREGLAITVGFEDLRSSLGRDNFNNVTNNGGIGDQINFYAGLNYSAHWGGFAVTAAYDALAPKIETVNTGFGTTTAITDRGGWAFKASAFLSLADYIPGGSLWAMYMNDNDYNTDYVHANRMLENPEEAWGVAYQMDLTDEVEFWVNYWDMEGGIGHAFNAPGLTTFNVGGINIINGTAIKEGGVRQVGIGLNWYPKAAPGFHVKASYVHGEVDNSGHAFLCDGFFGFPGIRGCSIGYDAFTVSLRRDF